MDLKKVTRFVAKNLPLVGLTSLVITEIKNREDKSFPYYSWRKKEDRKVLRNYAIQLGLSAFFIMKAGFVYKSFQNISNRIKESYEIEQTEKKESKLESTIHYHEAEKFIN